MKRFTLFFAVAALLAATLSITAFAYGGRGGGRRGGGCCGSAGGTPPYALCAVDDCEAYGPHEHDGNWYCNQAGVNWDNYDVCAVEGCNVIGLHEHDGTWYHCANYPNGGGRVRIGRR